MEFILTTKAQFSKHCPDGKRRNFLLHFLNDILILKLKIPYDDGNYSNGHDRRTSFSEIYLLNGKIYQTRTNDSKIVRHVKFPVSKKILSTFNIPTNLKILNEETNSCNRISR